MCVYIFLSVHLYSEEALLSQGALSVWCQPLEGERRKGSAQLPQGGQSTLMVVVEGC